MTEYINYMEVIAAKIRTEIIDKFQHLFIEGLRLKGFEFENRISIEQFIEKHVRCEEHQLTKERIYFVNNIPFFLHKYEQDDFTTFTEDRRTNFTVSYGYYKFL